MKMNKYQRFWQNALLLMMRVSIVRNNGQTKGDYFNRQSSSIAYPTGHVFKTLSAHSSLRCGMLCEKHETCEAYTYIKETNTCQLVDQPLSDADLISNGLIVGNCRTFIKASAKIVKEATPCNEATTCQSMPAQCTDPTYSDDIDDCSQENHNDMEAYLTLGTDALIFLNDSSYVYCENDRQHFYNHMGQECDKPKALSDVDPDGYFVCGPPDAAVQNGTYYLLFKGEMVYQYLSNTTKPYIAACDNMNCWASKTIKEHFGDWAPTHLDAALSDETGIYLIKGNLVFTASGNSKVHTMFPYMPCNITAAGGIYNFRNNEIYDGRFFDGITCLKKGVD